MMLVKYLGLRQAHFFKLLNIKKLKVIELLEPILEKYCKENFQNSTDIYSKLLEYKKLLLDANQNMNLIGKSTIDDFDQRHFLDCIQIHEYMFEKKKINRRLRHRGRLARSIAINYWIQKFTFG